MRIELIIILALILLGGRAMAQTESAEIRLLDSESSLPIADATFEYGEQQGLSSSGGIIRFVFEPGTSMSLSHINYGKWTLSFRDVQEVLRQGIIYRKLLTVNLYPVTVIGLRESSGQPVESLSMEYRERMEHDGADILNQIPAFNSIRKGGNYGFDPVFRSFQNERLNVVLNGAQSATVACPNRMDPPTSQMAPNMTDRIEVLKGPYALRYGTGLGATINFIPTPLRFSTESEVYGRLSTGYEENGDLIRGEGRLGFSGSHYDLSLFGAWSQGNDYRAGDGQTVQADFKRGSYGAVLGLKLSDRQQLRLSATYNRARDADFPALAMDLRRDDTWMFNLRHDIRIGGDHLRSWNTTLYGSFVDHLMNNLLKPLDPRMLNAETAAKTQNYGGRSEGVWQFGENSLYSGVDFRAETAEGERSREFLMGPMAGNTVFDNAWQDGKISRSAAFAELQLPGENWSYVISGRIELNQSSLRDPAAEFTDAQEEWEVNQINPSFSLGVLKDFGERFRTGLWLGRAQRSGGLAERYINFFPIGQDPFELLGTPTLEPEVNQQADLTFQWNGKRGARIEVDLFASYLTDYISSVIDTELTPRLPTSPGIRRFVNIDEVFKTGFEFNWIQPLFSGIQQQLSLAYTYGQDRERNEPLPEVAPLDIRYTLSGSYRDGALSPELSFRYVAEQNRVSGEFGETVTPSFFLVDVNVGYRLSKTLSIQAGAQNLLDANYYEHLNRSVRGTNNPIFAPGRNVYVNLNARF